MTGKIHNMIREFIQDALRALLSPAAQPALIPVRATASRRRR